MAVEKDEVIEAVFDTDTIRIFSSLAKAEEQKPLYIVVASNENHYNDNWLRKWEIQIYKTQDKDLLKDFGSQVLISGLTVHGFLVTHMAASQTQRVKFANPNASVMTFQNKY